MRRATRGSGTEDARERDDGSHREHEQVGAGSNGGSTRRVSVTENQECRDRQRGRYDSDPSRAALQSSPLRRADVLAHGGKQRATDEANMTRGHALSTAARGTASPSSGYPRASAGRVECRFDTHSRSLRARAQRNLVRSERAP
jgi:hypothetical protein